MKEHALSQLLLDVYLRIWLNSRCPMSKTIIIKVFEEILNFNPIEGVYKWNNPPNGGVSNI